MSGDRSVDCHGDLQNSLPAGEVPGSAAPGKSSGGGRQPDPPRVPVDTLQRVDLFVDRLEDWLGHRSDQRVIWGKECAEDCPDCVRLRGLLEAELMFLIADRLASRLATKIATIPAVAVLLEQGGGS